MVRVSQYLGILFNMVLLLIAVVLGAQAWAPFGYFSLSGAFLGMVADPL